MRPFGYLLLAAIGLCGIASAQDAADVPAHRHSYLAHGLPINRFALGENRDSETSPRSAVLRATAEEEVVVPPEPTDGPMPLDAETPPDAAAPMSLEEALATALTSNPDLVALRGGIPASAEAVNVARYFPTAINPTFAAEIRPIIREQPSPDATDPVTSMIFVLEQPIEFGHRRRLRTVIAEAAYSQTYWNVVQSEIQTLVQTYQAFQTAAYRRDKLQLARELAKFNDDLHASLQRRFDANQVSAAELALAEIEREATRQQEESAHIDYVNALTDLRNQIGIPETAASAEPAGEFTLSSYDPVRDVQSLVDTALANRPDLQSARAKVNEAQGAASLARAERHPVPSIGPAIERDEAGTQFYGFVFSTLLPVWNNGKPLVRQREAELQQAMIALQQSEMRVTTQIKAATGRWNQSLVLVRRIDSSAQRLKPSVATMERLFDAGQADISMLVQARKRLIELENASLDAAWQASQAQGDLLLTIGAPTLLGTAKAASAGANSAR